MASQISYLSSSMADEKVEDEEKCEAVAQEKDLKHAGLDEEVKAGMAPPICRICAPERPSFLRRARGADPPRRLRRGARGRHGAVPAADALQLRGRALGTRSLPVVERKKERNPPGV